jgi:phosphoribosylaminoimidazole-succinocarboxamide synthase
VWSKEDITAGNGARHDVMKGKDAIANQTTVNIFRFLQACGLSSLAFVDGYNPTAFLAYECKMLPYEVIVRREAHGSYLKRFPNAKKGDVLNRLLVQFFLKTSGQVWDGTQLPCDDPLIEFTSSGMNLHDPTAAAPGRPFLQIPDLDSEIWRPRMAELAVQTFRLLEEAWRKLDMRFVDYKVEFGLSTKGELLLADVIDADSGRLVNANNQYVDKQVYRDGGTVEQVFRNYIHIRDLTARFSPLPNANDILNVTGSYDLG